jgi:hypothetical protein
LGLSLDFWVIFSFHALLASPEESVQDSARLVSAVS